MPWWSWVLIWAGLVLALLAMLALGGWMLFRKAMTAAGALGQLLELTDRLEAASEELSPSPFTPAVLRDRDELRRAHDELTSARAERRELRRERRLARGRLLTSADLRKRTFPWESSATRSPGGT